MLLQRSKVKVLLSPSAGPELHTIRVVSAKVVIEPMLIRKQNITPKNSPETEYACITCVHVEPPLTTTLLATVGVDGYGLRCIVTLHCMPNIAHKPHQVTSGDPYGAITAICCRLVCFISLLLSCLFHSRPQARIPRKIIKLVQWEVEKYPGA